jgi:hypothetical protein
VVRSRAGLDHLKGSLPPVGCARAVKGMKMVASGEDSAATIRVERTDRETGSLSLTVL